MNQAPYPGLTPPPVKPPGMGMGAKIGLGFVALAVIIAIIVVVMRRMKKQKENEPVVCESGKSLNKRTNMCITTPLSGTLHIGDYCFETNSLCSSGNCYSVSGNCEVSSITSSSHQSMSTGSPSTVSTGTASFISTILQQLTHPTPVAPCAMSIALWALKNVNNPIDIETDKSLQSNIMNFFTSASIPVLSSKNTSIDPSFAAAAQASCLPVRACTANLMSWMTSIGYGTEVDTIKNYTGSLINLPSPFTPAQKSMFDAAFASHTLESVKKKDGTDQDATQKAIASSLNTACKDIIPMP